MTGLFKELWNKLMKCSQKSMNFPDLWNKLIGYSQKSINLPDLWNKLMGCSQKSMNLPEFPEDKEKRYQIIFSGIVQGVGFRYEVWMIAEKLGLAGFAENLSNGNVYVEVQGPENRIMYLIECMKSISRIQIDKIEMEEMVLKEEREFTPVY